MEEKRVAYCSKCLTLRTDEPTVAILKTEDDRFFRGSTGTPFSFRLDVSLCTLSSESVSVSSNTCIFWNVCQDGDQDQGVRGRFSRSWLEVYTSHISFPSVEIKTNPFERRERERERVTMQSTCIDQSMCSESFDAEGGRKGWV